MTGVAERTDRRLNIAQVIGKLIGGERLCHGGAVVDVIVDLPGGHDMLEQCVGGQERLGDLVGILLVPGICAERIAGYLNRESHHMLLAILAFFGSSSVSVMSTRWSASVAAYIRQLSSIGVP